MTNGNAFFVTEVLATLQGGGVTSVLTLNRSDFANFGSFTFPK